MSEVKRILIVDDHFDTLRFLRSLLELADSRYEVVSVRSGEEAGLELRRPYDLLITDMRLPGVDGSEVAKRARKASPAMPIIVISGFAKELARIEQLGVDIYCYFRKPLDADAMLAAVQTALWGELPLEEAADEAVIEEEYIEETVQELIVDPSVPSEVQRRLDLLRRNTGAEELMLGTISGQIAAESGTVRLDLAALARTVAENLKGTFTLADQLGTDEHQTIQYLTSKRYDVYTANVGEYHFVTMFFDAQARRGRIGTVWVFVQRAIKDLQPLLAHTKVETVEKTIRRKRIVEKGGAAERAEIIQKVAEAVPTAPILVKEEERPPAKEEAPEPPLPPVELPDTPPAVYEPPPRLDLEPLSDADLKKLESLDFDDGEAGDDFWEAAAAPVDDQPLTGGVSFEEAMRQGLLANLDDLPTEDVAERSERPNQPAATSAEPLPKHVPTKGATAEELAAAVPSPEETGLAPAEGLPDFLKMAAGGGAPVEESFTLDLGPVGDDDFDLSGMPMGDGDAAEGGLGLDLGPMDGDDFDLSGMPMGDEAPAEDPAMAALAEMTGEKQQIDPEKEAEAFWNAIVSGNTGESSTEDGMTFEAAFEEGLSSGQSDDDVVEGIDDEALAQILADDGGGDVDSFWDEALSELDGGTSTGITLEEARKKGLISSDLDFGKK